jgi:hypothetical protein
MSTSSVLETASNLSVVDNLMKKLDAVQAAFNRKQPTIAVQLLETFIHQVKANAGARIEFHSAVGLIEHAQAIIDSILFMRNRLAAMETELPQISSLTPGQLDQGRQITPSTLGARP